MFIAKLYFSEDCQISVYVDPDSGDVKVVEEKSGYELEGTLADPNA